MWVTARQRYTQKARRFEASFSKKEEIIENICDFFSIFNLQHFMAQNMSHSEVAVDAESEAFRGFAFASVIDRAADHERCVVQRAKDPEAQVLKSAPARDW